jgi:hypothetical protein
VRREQRNESLKVLVGFLDHGVLEIHAQIGAVAKNSELTDSEKVQRICASALVASSSTSSRTYR